MAMEYRWNTATNQTWSSIDDDLFSEDTPPSYIEHKRSPRCKEDIINPAPSYASLIQLSKPSGADKLAEWLVARTGKVFNRE
jgi:hypothetical protein